MFKEKIGQKKKNSNFRTIQLYNKEEWPFLRSSHQLMDSHRGHTFCSLRVYIEWTWINESDRSGGGGNHREMLHHARTHASSSKPTFRSCWDLADVYYPIDTIRSVSLASHVYLFIFFLLFFHAQHTKASKKVDLKWFAAPVAHCSIACATIKSHVIFQSFIRKNITKQTNKIKRILE